MAEYFVLIYNGPQVAYIDISEIPNGLVEIMKKIGNSTVTGYGGAAPPPSINTYSHHGFGGNDLYSLVRLAFFGEASFEKTKEAKKFAKELGLECSVAVDDKNCLCLEGMHLRGQNRFPTNGRVIGIFGFTDL
jgi:hypothetical protein